MRKVYSGMGIAVPKATEDWLSVAGEADMKAWLAKAGNGGSRVDGGDRGTGGAK